MHVNEILTAKEARESKNQRVLIVPPEFKYFFILLGNDVIKTVLGNIDVRNVVFAPVEEIG